jgi:hypothetical protein
VDQDCQTYKEINKPGKFNFSNPCKNKGSNRYQKSYKGRAETKAKIHREQDIKNKGCQGKVREIHSIRTTGHIEICVVFLYIIFVVQRLFFISGGEVPSGAIVKVP